MSGIIPPNRWPSYDQDHLLAYMCGVAVSPVRPEESWPKSDDFMLEIVLALATPKQVWPVDPPACTNVRQDEVPKATEFERQKEAFKGIPEMFLAPYRGKFVASLDGVIVDWDTDLASLSHRFRERFGKVPVYITRVGKAARMPTPYIVR